MWGLGFGVECLGFSKISLASQRFLQRLHRAYGGSFDMKGKAKVRIRLLHVSVGIPCSLKLRH